MIPALRPYVAEIVPKVRPVLMSKVVYIACGRMYRRDTGRTPANFNPIFTPKNLSTSGTAVASAPRLTLRPPLKKKKGVSSENATTRNRRCCSGLRWNTRATARPSRKAGTT